MSPGATTSGLIRPSSVGPRELKAATASRPDVSMSGDMTAVAESCVLPEVEAPTARTFLAMAGLLIVHDDRTVSPVFPAANISKFSGFYAQRHHEKAKEWAEKELEPRAGVGAHEALVLKG